VARLWCLVALSPKAAEGIYGFPSMRRRERLGVGAGAVAAILVVAVSFAVGAAPLIKSPSPSEPVASHLSLLHRALIYAK